MSRGGRVRLGDRSDGPTGLFDVLGRRIDDELLHLSPRVAHEQTGLTLEAHKSRQVECGKQNAGGIAFVNHVRERFVGRASPVVSADSSQTRAGRPSNGAYAAGELTLWPKWRFSTCKSLGRWRRTAPDKVSEASSKYPPRMRTRPKWTEPQVARAMRDGVRNFF